MPPPTRDFRFEILASFPVRRDAINDIREAWHAYPGCDIAVVLDGLYCIGVQTVGYGRHIRGELLTALPYKPVQTFGDRLSAVSLENGNIFMIEDYTSQVQVALYRLVEEVKGEET